MALVALAACTGGNDVAPTTTVPATTTSAPAPVEPDADPVRELALALAAGVPAADAVVPGSPVDRYVRHRTVAAGILGEAVQGTVRETAAGFDVCAADGSCRSYSGVVLDDASGRVVDVAIDGIQLAGRIGADGPATTVDDIAVAVASVLESPDGVLSVAVEVTNGRAAPIEVFAFAATYAPSGSGVAIDASGAWGEGRVGPAATRPFLLTFDDATIGGTLRFTALADDGPGIELRAAVPAP